MIRRLNFNPVDILISVNTEDFWLRLKLASQVDISDLLVINNDCFIYLDVYMAQNDDFEGLF